MASMPAASEEEEVDEPEATSLRDNFVLSGDQLVEDFNVGILYFLEPPVSVAVISVTLVDDRVLVALPDSAWNRLKRDRVIPATALQKPVRVEVQSCSESDRARPLGEPDLRLWLGLLGTKSSRTLLCTATMASRCPTSLWGL